MDNSSLNKQGYEENLQLICKILSEFKLEGMQIVYLIFNYKEPTDQ